MSGPEPVSPKPSVGQVMVWWGTASPAPGDGSTPEEVLPKPSSGQLMVWHWDFTPTSVHCVSVGMILAGRRPAPSPAS